MFASNFPIVLAALASGLLHDAGVDERSAWAAVRSLLSAAVANLEGREPADALTGPIARGDAGTVARPLEALSGDPARRELYRVLSRAALALAREGKTAPPALDAVARLLDDA